MPCHQPIKEAVAFRLWTPVGKNRTRHLPIDVYRREVNGNEPNAANLCRLVALLENGSEHGGMEFLDVIPPVSMSSRNVREIAILGESQREGMRVVVIPRVDESLNGPTNRGFVLGFIHWWPLLSYGAGCHENGPKQ